MLSALLTACQNLPVVGKQHCPPVPTHLLTEKAAPVFDFDADGTITNQQLVENGIHPLYSWGSEGWSRLRQIRLLQEKCELD